jgi:hypothetical protein
MFRFGHSIILFLLTGGALAAYTGRDAMGEMTEPAAPYRALAAPDPESMATIVGGLLLTGLSGVRRRRWR